VSARRLTLTESGSVQPNPVSGRRLASLPPKSADLTPLEDFMRRLLTLIGDHPEWRNQSAPERMNNFLVALQKL